MVSIEDLSEKFQEQEFTRMDYWGLHAEFRLLIQNLPGGIDNKISKISVISLGLLWCKGSNAQKAEVFFNTINQGKSHAVNNDDHVLH